MNFLLQALFEHSLRHNLATHMEEQRVLLELRLNKDGFEDLVLINKLLQVPRVVKDRSSGIEPRSFYDTVKYTLTPGKHFEEFWDQVERGGPARVVTAAKAFRESTKSWTTRVAQLLEGFQRERPDLNIDKDPLVVISLRGVKGYLHELTEAVIKPELLDIETECSVTGILCQPVRLHPSVKGVPNTQKGRVPLVSYNAPVYEFEGRQQGSNFPVSAEVALGYTAALSNMLSREGENGRRRKSGVELPDGRVLLMWSASREVDLGPVFDVATVYHSKDDPTAVQEAWTRFDALLPSEDTVYVLVLKGDAGRISALRWEHHTYGEVLEGVQRYREDFNQVTNAPTFLSLMNSLESENQLLSDTAKAEAYEALLLGLPLPRALFTFAVDRMTESLETQKYNQSWSYALPIKVSWVNSYLRRKNMPTTNRPPETIEKPDPKDYFPANASPAFHEGRWLAVAEQLQYNYVNRRGRAQVNNPLGSKLREFSSHTLRTKNEIRTRLIPVYTEKSDRRSLLCLDTLDEIATLLAQHTTPRRTSEMERADIAKGYDMQKLYFKRLRIYNKQDNEGEFDKRETDEAAE